MVIREAVVYKQKHFFFFKQICKMVPLFPLDLCGNLQNPFEAVLLLAFNFQTTKILKTKSIRNQNWLIFGRNVMILLIVITKGTGQGR